MGRGSSGAGENLTNGGGGVNPANIHNERDLVSERGNKQAEVDAVLTTARGISESYGVDVGQFVIADVSGGDSNTLAYSDGENIGFNSRYFNSASMEKAYADCVKSGFHPYQGNKSAMEAVAAHEYGHVLSDKAAAKLGQSGRFSMDSASETIVKRAMAQSKARGGSKNYASKISGYAKTSYAECVAEAVADVYCNGRNAKAESRAIVSVINDILK